METKDKHRETITHSIPVTALILLITCLLPGCTAISGVGRSVGVLPTLTPTPTPTPVASPTPIPCHIQAQEFIKGVDGMLLAWDDANALAGRTSRIALAGPVGRLQELRRQMLELPAPPCVRTARAGLQQYMDAVIDGYLLFMSDQPDSEVSKKFAEADGYLKRAVEWLAEVKGAQP